jgi:hypothetical protein
LELPIQLVRDLYYPIKDKQGKMIEPSRICLEHQHKVTGKGTRGIHVVCSRGIMEIAMRIMVPENLSFEGRIPSLVG